ncbi:MAG TPA: ferritin-like domain-containing protein [Candidatus Binatia bacterium]|nr:ferritin-like domain-containing protein [Candidatus Binatia bacterium]
MPLDPAYQAVAPEDFPAMLHPARYGRRSPHFEEIIARTEEHFWNPEDPDYIRFDEPWPADEPILPLNFVVESHTAVWDRLDEGQRVAFANETARWLTSNLLHGEQGALSLSATLCEIFLDPGAQEYAANQVREEARHVHAFTRYVGARFGGDAFPVGDTIGDLLSDLVRTETVYKKIVGMQMLVEGLAMGAFTTLHKMARDPLLRRLCQLVMTDEAFHHKFGKIWAHATVPTLEPEEHAVVEDWAVACFNRLLFNLVNSEQKRLIYPRFGLDWQWVRGAVLEAFTDADRREQMRQSTNVFRTLVKTLLAAGIITERTRSQYAMWVDMEELSREKDRMVGEEVAEEGIRELREINAGKRKIVRKIASATV